MDNITKETLIPKKLADILIIKIYSVYSDGGAIEKAVKEGIQVFNNYWEEKNADKSGG